MQQMLVGLYTGSVLVQTERLSPGLVPDKKPFPLFHGGVRRAVLFSMSYWTEQLLLLETRAWSAGKKRGKPGACDYRRYLPPKLWRNHEIPSAKSGLQCFWGTGGLWDACGSTFEVNAALQSTNVTIILLAIAAKYWLSMWTLGFRHRVGNSCCHIVLQTTLEGNAVFGLFLITLLYFYLQNPFKLW